MTSGFGTGSTRDPAHGRKASQRVVVELFYAPAERYTGNFRVDGEPGGEFSLVRGTVAAVDSPGVPGIPERAGRCRPAVAGMAELRAMRPAVTDGSTFAVASGRLDIRCGAVADGEPVVVIAGRVAVLEPGAPVAGTVRRSRAGCGDRSVRITRPARITRDAPGSVTRCRDTATARDRGAAVASCRDATELYWHGVAGLHGDGVVGLSCCGVAEPHGHGAVGLHCRGSAQLYGHGVARLHCHGAAQQYGHGVTELYCPAGRRRTAARQRIRAVAAWSIHPVAARRTGLTAESAAAGGRRHRRTVSGSSHRTPQKGADEFPDDEQRSGRAGRLAGHEPENGGAGMYRGERPRQVDRRAAGPADRRRPSGGGAGSGATGQGSRRCRCEGSGGAGFAGRCFETVLGPRYGDDRGYSEAAEGNSRRPRGGVPRHGERGNAPHADPAGRPGGRPVVMGRSAR